MMLLNGGIERWMTSQLEMLGLAYWLEVQTTPQCTYYFGPFATAKQAHRSESKYLGELQKEGVQILWTQIHRCRPYRHSGFIDYAL